MQNIGAQANLRSRSTCRGVRSRMIATRVQGDIDRMKRHLRRSERPAQRKATGMSFLHCRRYVGSSGQLRVVG